MIWILAHGNETHLSQALWGWWTWDPFVLVVLVVSGGVYARGVRRLWARAGVGHGIRKWEAGAFAAAWISVFIALISPLDPLSDILFSAHMAQHEVLMLVSAPLFVLGRTLLAFLWAFGAERREWIGRWIQSPRVTSAWHGITGPLVVWVLHAVALWVWHVPSLYEGALRNDAVHAVQHLCFFVTACLFWWALVYGRFGKIGYGMAVFYVFTTAVHSSILGALLTVARRLWYPIYEVRTMQWHLDALEDQQLAGLLMWVPAGVIFLVLGLALFAAWLGEAERRVAHTRSETLARLHEIPAAGGVDEA
ncbi:MAG: cytochrome c oxidase assembly protein [Thermoanaerobaculia bacterium]